MAKVGQLRSNKLGSAGGVASAGAGAAASLSLAKKLKKAINTRSEKKKSQEELVKSAREKIRLMSPKEKEAAREQIEKAKSDRKTKKVNDQIDKVLEKKGDAASKRKRVRDLNRKYDRSGKISKNEKREQERLERRAEKNRDEMLGGPSSGPTPKRVRPPSRKSKIKEERKVKLRELQNKKGKK